VESVQQCQDRSYKTTSYAATGLPDSFDVMDGASDGESRIEFVDFQRSDVYAPVQVPASSPTFSESSLRPRPLTTLGVHDEESPAAKGPTLLAHLGSPHGWTGEWNLDSPRKKQVSLSAEAVSHGPKVGREGLKALKATRVEQDSTGKHAFTTRSRGSRFSASTISVEECMSSDSEADRTSTTARCSTRGTRSLTSNSTTIEEPIPVKEAPREILYPWEMEAIVAQATVPTCSRSRPSSPTQVLANEFGKKANRGKGFDDKGERTSSTLPGQCDEEGDVAGEGEISRNFSDLGPLATDVGRAKMFLVQLERRDELSRLGLDTRPLVSDVTGALRVERIRVGGLVDEWNRANSRSASEANKTARKHRIRKGDLIVEVNGLRGSSDGMYKVITSDTSLKLLVMRLPSSYSGPFSMATSRSMATSSSVARETADEDRASN